MCVFSMNDQLYLVLKNFLNLKLSEVLLEVQKFSTVKIVFSCFMPVVTRKGKQIRIYKKAN